MIATTAPRLDAAIGGPHCAASRPANRARLVFHLVCSVLTLVLLQLVSPRVFAGVALAVALSCWVLEGLRRLVPAANVLLLRAFDRIVHASESDRINSATWYATSIALVAATGQPTLVAVAVAVAGFGDPAASFAGRRWGGRSLRDDRTLEGTVAFFVAGAFAGCVALQLTLDAAPLVWTWGIASAAAIAGAVAELTSRDVDDNFSVPVISAVAALLVIS